MHTELIQKYAAPVPRYTSYPTAPHFSPDVDHGVYSEWLEKLPEGEPLSLYAHIPFCDILCWYCGCNTKMVQKYKPVNAYMQSLLAEIDHVGSRIGSRHEVSHIHWGGGSPNILKPQDILDLADMMRRRFKFADDMEFAVEIDPRDMPSERISAFVEAGVTRISLGVQDFHIKVQEAINRLQSFEDTKEVIDRFRDAGIGSANIDLVYGLPYQTAESVAETIDQVLELAPDRIALFGYAHLPSRLPRQRLIPDESLPGPDERYVQSNLLADHIVNAGYVRIGLDHFAKPTDKLAAEPVKRNFQGYTSDDADTLIGFGASAIGHLPQGYVQNSVPTGEYIRNINEHGLAVAKGFAMSQEDQARALVINKLMCDLTFPAEDLRARYDGLADRLVGEAKSILAADEDGLLEKTEDGFRITETGRPFVRTICAKFDTYLQQSTAQHSSGV